MPKIGPSRKGQWGRISQEFILKRELYAKIQRIVEQELVIPNIWTFAILIKRKDLHQTWYEHFNFNPPDSCVKMITDNKQYVLFDILLSIRYYMNFGESNGFLLAPSLLHLPSYSCINQKYMSKYLSFFKSITYM